MISLKKNDKLILIVAVVILVIAGIGVAMYQSPEAPTDFSSLIVNQKSYNVSWTLLNGSLNTISDFAGKKAPYSDTVTIPEGNVNSVTFNLTWTDDRMTVMKRMGLDSLTLEVTMPDGVYSFKESGTSAPKTGDGTVTRTIVKDMIPPQIPIKADTAQEAQTILKTPPYYDDSWTDKPITINVSCHVGEMRLRILKQLREKGNDFELKISYQYYNGVLEEDSTKNTGGDSNLPPDDIWAEQEIIPPPYISMIISTGCGRYI
ncbi:MAG: hypothetical protein WC525_03100 [Candidatus Thermoplasmatota archaeon]